MGLTEEYGLAWGTSTCDHCEDTIKVAERWHALAPRWSTGVMTEVMWMCKGCGEEYGLSPHTDECEERNLHD